MTPHTDAERAEFERLIEGHGGPALSLRLRKNEDGTYHWAETQELFAMFRAGASWQAARRAPAAPVPQGYDSGVQTGNRVTLAFDTQSNATAWFEKFCDDYDAAAGTKTIKLPIPADAAPQPPEAAPVELPEPSGVVVTTIGNYASVNAAPFVRKGDKFYTEQQVRELLAAHGIGAPS